MRNICKPVCFLYLGKYWVNYSSSQILIRKEQLNIVSVVFKIVTPVRNRGYYFVSSYILFISTLLHILKGLLLMIWCRLRV